MKPILVTGVSGFIGRAVADSLSARGHIIWGLDRSPKPIPGVSFVQQGDVLNDALVHEMVQESSGVINLAGLLGTSELLKHVRDAVQINIEAAVGIYDACLRYDVPLVQITVGNHTWTQSIYPITKVAAERLALVYGMDCGLRVAVVRAMNVYGPWQKHAPVRKYIPNLIRWAFRGEPAEIYGGGEQLMDPIWVGDTAEVLRCALEYAANGGQPRVFEAGYGIGFTANEVADSVWGAVHGPDARRMPKVHIAMRPGEPRHSVTVADPKSLGPLGIVPFRDFLPLWEGLARAVAWYRANPGILGLSTPPL